MKFEETEFKTTEDQLGAYLLSDLQEQNLRNLIVTVVNEKAFMSTEEPGYKMKQQRALGQLEAYEYLLQLSASAKETQATLLGRPQASSNQPQF